MCFNLACCSLTNITGKVKYNKRKKRTTLTFSSDDMRAKYRCKLDKRRFKKCKLNICKVKNKLLPYTVRKNFQVYDVSQKIKKLLI